MKLLIIPQAYPDRENPTLTTFIEDNTIALQELGYDVAVAHVKMLSFRRWNLLKGNHVEKHAEDTVKRLSINMRYVHGFERVNTKNFYRLALKLFKVYCAENGLPDVIVSHFSQYAGYSATKIAKKYDVPIVNIEHAGWLLQKCISKYENKKLKYVAQKSNSFICVSEELKKSIANKVNTCNIAVVPNMIDERYQFHQIMQKSRYVFFAAGNLYEGKRFPMLVKAFCNAFSGNEPVELRIAGVGNQYSLINSIIQTNKRENQIFMLGALDKQHMLKEYVYSDCFVLPSEHETFGIVYREAMAVGRPIITTNHQGFNNEWDDAWGIRISVDSQEKLEKALLDMRQDSNRFDGAFISRTCLDRYSKEIIMLKYKNIIEQVCSRS